MAEDITIRKIEFEFPDDIDPFHLVKDCPEESFVNVGLSLLLPYLEPYLIRSMKQAKQQVTDEDLKTDIDNFNGQESQHYKQHKKFNDVVRRGFEGLEAFEERLSADYHRFSDQRSLRFNLAYAEGFEAYTGAFALFALEHGLFERFHPVAKEMFLWHLTEEIEHRTVAFDVYQHVSGGYFYRLFVGLFAQWHMTSWVVSVGTHLVKAQQARVEKECGGKPGARARFLSLLWLQVRYLMPKILKTYLPWYTPRKVKVPRSLVEILDRYNRMAGSPA